MLCLIKFSASHCYSMGQQSYWRSEHLCFQDLVLAERLLMKHLDAPGRWLAEKHRRMLMNKYCGRYLRDKHLHHYVIYGESVQDRFEHNRRLRNPSTTSVQQALHGLAYCVYGKPDVRRLMFEVFDFEQVQPKAVWGCSPWVIDAKSLAKRLPVAVLKILQHLEVK